jgi:hypothetical protein
MNNMDNIIINKIDYIRTALLYDKLDYQNTKEILENYSIGTIVVLDRGGIFLVNDLGLTPLSSCTDAILPDENGSLRIETKEEKIERYKQMIEYYKFLIRNV